MSTRARAAQATTTPENHEHDRRQAPTIAKPRSSPIDPTDRRHHARGTVTDPRS